MARKVAKVLENFLIDEISPVDRPAQEPADAVLMKRREADSSGTAVEKRVYLTTIVNGHQHMIDVADQEMRGTSWDLALGDETGHSHRFVHNTDGSITIAVVDGHKHDVLDDDTLAVVVTETAAKRAFSSDERKRLADKGFALSDGSYPIETVSDLKNAIRAFGRASNQARVAKHIKKRARALDATDLLPEEGLLSLSKADSRTDGGAGDTDTDLNKEGQMSDQKKAAGAGVDKAAEDKDVDARVSELEKKLERSNAMAALTDAEKAFMKGLDETAQETFLKAKPEDRAKDLEKAKAEDPVVYTATDGREFRKSDDVRLVKMARNLDEERDLSKRQREKAEGLELRKRAVEEIPNLPGTEDTKVALLKSIDAIEDEEVRKAALESLHANNAEMAKAFERAGATGTRAPSGESAEGRLEALAKKRASDKSIDFDKAYDEVLKTDEGRELYKAYLEENPAQKLAILQ